MTPTPGLATQPGPPPVSDGTCQALLQLAGGGNIASTSNNCQVNRQCTTVNCNDYLGLYDFMLVLLACNDPPGIMFVAYDDSNNLVFNETITDSRTIPLGDFGSIVGTVDHPCGQEAIIVKVIY